MMPIRTPQEDAERLALIKSAITVVRDAVNGCGGDAVSTEKICRLIDLQCSSPAVRNMAYNLLASALVTLARDKAAGVKVVPE